MRFSALGEKPLSSRKILVSESCLGLGPDYDEPALHNPDVIPCSLSGYGRSDCHSKHSAFDVTIQTPSSLMGVIDEEHFKPGSGSRKASSK